MIANFFRRLESTEVDYLLISGQATILYGAATFSEDVDLWLMPSEPNIERFMDVLRASSASYYKLTPPLTLENLDRGHGFHFVLPGETNAPEVYLDVMGRPPRVGSFESALASARFFDTDFGRVHTVGIKELIEIKKNSARRTIRLSGGSFSPTSARPRNRSLSRIFDGRSRMCSACPSFERSSASMRRRIRSSP